MNEQEVSDLYSNNAENYAVKFFQPWKVNTEGYSIMKNILGHGNFTSTSFEGKNILDLGCGGGNYVRQFLKLGANRAVGVDLSPGLIQLANQITEAQNSDGSRYAFYQADCFNYSEVIQNLSNEPLKEFDITISVWVICYASTSEELNNIVEIASHFTKPGGTFICMIPNPESFFNPDEDFNYTIQYGATFKRCVEETPIPRRKVTFLDLHTGELLFEVYNYYTPYKNSPMLSTETRF